MSTVGQRWASRQRTLLHVVGVCLAAVAALCSSGEEAPKESKERVVELGGGVSLRFVLVPAGSFTMGITEAELKGGLNRWLGTPLEGLIAHEMPGHKATLSKAFYMGRHEVTVGQYRRFVDATGYKTDAEKGTRYKGAYVAAGMETKIAEDASWRNPQFKQADEHPVVCVSWNDARAFADWLNATDKAKPEGLGYRLPTEAEWEYACRAGSSTWYHWGDIGDDGSAWCNAADQTAKKVYDLAVFKWNDGHLYTAPVGSFKANAFGLHDMHGNVEEWCQDWFGPYVAGEHKDPTGPPSGEKRVVRGGSWYGEPLHVRSARRDKGGSSDRCQIVGFRLVLGPRPD